MGKGAYHEHRPTSIKPRPIRILPHILDPVRVPPHETFDQILESAFDGFGVAFEGGFAPACVVVGCLDADEEPAGGEAEELWLGRGWGDGWVRGGRVIRG